MSETIRAYCWGCGKTDAWRPVTATAPDGSTYPAYASECGRIIEDASLLRWRVESQKRKQAAKNRRCGLFGRVGAWLTGSVQETNSETHDTTTRRDRNRTG